MKAAVYYPLMGNSSILQEEVDGGDDEEEEKEDDSDWGAWKGEAASFSAAADTTVQYTVAVHVGRDVLLALGAP